MNDSDAEQSFQSSVEVVIRLQPPENSDYQILSGHSLSCANKQYFFDYIFPFDTSQEQIYEKIGMKMISSAKKGYNCCIFAYGQTGSGKTYTMTGSQNQQGLIQRCMKGLFKMLESFESFQLKMSYFEIYNEQINDLLSNIKKGKDKVNIKIKESVTLGFYLENLQQIKVENYSDLVQNLQKGIRNRTTAETKMNRQSSRSHSILTLYINSKLNRSSGDGFSILSSKMHFVDLAGSEKQKSTLAAGERLKEASSINKSLTSLSIVIQKLSLKSTHIPYRDSVLTKILRDSIGGNSKTILLSTISSKQESIAESISTLNFATKAKKVKQSARINQQIEGSLSSLKQYIKKLQQQIKGMKNKQKEGKCSECQIFRLRQQNLVQQIQKLQQEKNKIQVQCKQEIERKQTEYKQKLQQHYENQSKDKYWGGFVEEDEPFNQYMPNGDFFQQGIYDQNNLSTILENTNENTLVSFKEDFQFLQKGLNITNSSFSQNHNNNNGSFSLNQIFEKKRRRANKAQGQNKNTSFGKINSIDQINHIFIIKSLEQEKLIQQAQINILKMQIKNFEKERQKSTQENLRVFQPIVRKWIEDNGEAIKNNVKARNGIEQDIIAGLRSKLKRMEGILCEKQTIWSEKENYFRSLIDQLRRTSSQYQEQFKKVFQQQTQQLGNQTISNQQNQHNFSKSHPRLNQQQKRINVCHNEISGRQSQIIDDHKRQYSKLNNTFQKLRQEFECQQLIKQQLIKQSEDYRARWESLNNQIQESKNLAKYWQEKYLAIRNKKMDLEQELLKERIEKEERNRLAQMIKRSQEEADLKRKQHERQRSMKNQQQKDLLLRKLQLQLVEKTERIAFLQKQQNITTSKISNLSNLAQNKNEEVQCYKKRQQSWKKSFEEVEENKMQVERKLSQALTQISRLKENNAYISEDLQRKLKIKQREISDIQKQSGKQYIEWLDSLDKCKLLSMKYKQLKQNYEKLKQNNELLRVKYKDLTNFIQQDQSTSLRDIHKLNETNTQLLEQVQRKQQKLNYLINQFNNKNNEIKYWKDQYEKQKKWATDFKKMQQNFMTSQSSLRNQQSAKKQLDRSGSNKNKFGSSHSKEKNIVGSNRKQQRDNPLLAWEHNQSKRQIQEIANRLGEICQIKATKTNLILHLDEISQKINELKALKQENKSLKAKNKMLMNQRNSDFWQKIE